MSAPWSCPADFALIVHDSPSDGFEFSQVLLATASFEGTLELLTSGWERALGYARGELKGRTLGSLLESHGDGAAAAAAAILDRLTARAVDLSLSCRNGVRKRFRLHRRYDSHEQLVYLVAEEISAERRGTLRARPDRRAAARRT